MTSNGLIETIVVLGRSMSKKQAMSRDFEREFLLQGKLWGFGTNLEVFCALDFLAIAV